MTQPRPTARAVHTPHHRDAINPPGGIPPAPRNILFKPEAEYVAFAIKEHPQGTFTPVRIMIEGDRLVHETPLHEGLPEESLAYEYLSGDVMLEYSRKAAANR